MEEGDEIVYQRRQVAIKLAKNLESFNPKLGELYDAIYIETLTEDIKQSAREIKKLAKAITEYMKWIPEPEQHPMTVVTDGETEPITKMMRRHSTRIQKMADLIYEVAYIDFAGLEQEEIKDMMKVDEEGDDDDEDA